MLSPKCQTEENTKNAVGKDSFGHVNKMEAYDAIVIPMGMFHD